MTESRIEYRTLGIYFVDRYNFPSLCDSADSGDEIAVNIGNAVISFIKEGPPPVCAMCRERDDPSTMTIVVMRTEHSTLTSWICEDCSTRDDIDAEIEKIIRRWPAIPKNAVIEIMKKDTLH